MNQRPSLLDQAGISANEPAPKKAARGGGSALSPEKLKLIGAAAVLVAALVLIAWSMGVFKGKPAKTDPGVQAQREEVFDEQTKEEEQLDARSRQRRPTSGG